MSFAMNSTNLTGFGNETIPPERFLNIPAAIYVGICSVTGAIGNTIVLYVYFFKFKQNTFNTFIIFLALFDIVCCVVEMPLDIVNMVHPVGFPGCKPIVIIGTTTAMSTGLTLVAIAVLRYKGICQPLKPNISVAQARFISLLSLTTALIVSWPSAVMITNVLDDLKDGIVVMNCASNEYFEDTLYPLIFNAILFLIFFTSFLTLIVLYSIIGRQLWLRKKNGPASIRVEHSVKQSSNATKGLNNSSKGSKRDDPGHPVNKEMNCVQDSSSRKAGEFSTSFITQNEQNVCCVQSIENEHSSNSSTTSNNSTTKLVSIRTGPRRSSKTFKMLFIVTLIFLLSYLPHLSLMIYEAVGSDLDLTCLGESVVGIVIRSYLINSASNPIIYGCCNGKFRAEIHAIFKRMKTCLHIM